MKALFISFLFVVAIIVGYFYISEQQEHEVAQQHEQREQQMMQQQKKFQDQTRNLGQQMQQDLDNRMGTAESKE